MLNICIFYADSEFTTWEENIDFGTVEFVSRHLPPTSSVSVIHMERNYDAVARKLSSFDIVVNLCYGYEKDAQADIAQWLDNNGIHHLSSSGHAQQRAQDKLYVENLCIENHISVPISITASECLHDQLYILKPRFGGCHRGIHILNGTGMLNLLKAGDYHDFLLQPYLVGREFSIAIIPNEDGTDYIALPPVEILPDDDRIIYVAGNSFGKTYREFYFKIDPVLVQEMTNAALKIHRLLGLKYMSRADFRVSNGKSYLLDINTMPNLHPEKSIMPALVEYHRIGMSSLLDRFIKVAFVTIPELNIEKKQLLHAEKH